LGGGQLGRQLGAGTDVEPLVSLHSTVLWLRWSWSATSWFFRPRTTSSAIRRSFSFSFSSTRRASHRGPGGFPGINASRDHPVVVTTATKINASMSSHIALTVTDVAGNVITCDPLWPGEKAAKPASRAKHQRVGRHAAGWGRRTT
jgi:hypothetical protein